MWPHSHFWGLGADLCQKHLISSPRGFSPSTWYLLFTFLVQLLYLTTLFYNRDKILDLLITSPEMDINFTIFYFVKVYHKASSNSRGREMNSISEKRNYIIFGDNLWKQSTTMEKYGRRFGL